MEYSLIVIAKNESTPRRRFFIITHEVYHLLTGEVYGEEMANKFADAMLITKREICELLQLNPSDSQIEISQLEQCFKALYQYFPVSLECIIATLLGYKLISKDIGKMYLGRENAQKHKQIIKKLGFAPRAISH